MSFAVNVAGCIAENDVLGARNAKRVNDTVDIIVFYCFFSAKIVKSND